MSDEDILGYEAKRRVPRFDKDVLDKSCAYEEGLNKCSRCGFSFDWTQGQVNPRPSTCKAVAAKNETVNHPQHYGGDTTYETIKVLEAWLTKEEFAGFCLGNATKYLSRWRKKNGDEDLKKAYWYLGKYLETRQ